MSIVKTIILDFKNNPDLRSKYVVCVWRICSTSLLFNRSCFSLRFIIDLLYSPFIFLLKFNKWFMGVDIPRTVMIGQGLVIFHAQNIVIHPRTIIGNKVILRHNLTIGERGGVDVPVINDCVDLGASVTVLGGITIGAHCKIGAGCVVVHSIPSNSVVIGQKGQVIKSGCTI